MLHRDELEVDRLDHTSSSGNQTTCHEKAEANLDLLRYLEIPKDNDRVDGQNDIGKRSPASSPISTFFSYSS